MMADRDGWDMGDQHKQELEDANFTKHVRFDPSCQSARQAMAPGIRRKWGQRHNFWTTSQFFGRAAKGDAT
jgi:hypothetical protein